MGALRRDRVHFIEPFRRIRSPVPFPRQQTGEATGLARGWAITGIGDATREAAMAAADAAGMAIGAWVEQALRQALEAKPASPEGVEIDELEAMVRQVVAEELQPVREALAQVTTMALPSASAAGSPVSLMRERRRQHRVR